MFLIPARIDFWKMTKTQTICTEQERNKAQKQTFIEHKRNGTQTQINGIKRKQNGNFFINTTVCNKDLILEQSGCLWL